MKRHGRFPGRSDVYDLYILEDKSGPWKGQGQLQINFIVPFFAPDQTEYNFTIIELYIMMYHVYIERFLKPSL